MAELCRCCCSVAAAARAAAASARVAATAAGVSPPATSERAETLAWEDKWYVKPDMEALKAEALAKWSAEEEERMKLENEAAEAAAVEAEAARVAAEAAAAKAAKGKDKKGAKGKPAPAPAPAPAAGPKPVLAAVARPPPTGAELEAMVELPPPVVKDGAPPRPDHEPGATRVTSTTVTLREGVAQFEHLVLSKRTPLGLYEITLRDVSHEKLATAWSDAEAAAFPPLPEEKILVSVVEADAAPAGKK